MVLQLFFFIVSSSSYKVTPLPQKTRQSRDVLDKSIGSSLDLLLLDPTVDQELRMFLLLLAVRLVAKGVM